MKVGAFELGIAAYNNCKELEDNPYAQGTKEFVQWEKGWLHAQFLEQK